LGVVFEKRSHEQICCGLLTVSATGESNSLSAVRGMSADDYLRFGVISPYETDQICQVIDKLVYVFHIALPDWGTVMAPQVKAKPAGRRRRPWQPSGKMSRINRSCFKKVD
jgi:hypothetical protein